MAHKFILTITCPDVSGIVAAVSGCLAEKGAFIIEAAQYGDPDTQTFFMRVVFSSADLTQNSFAAHFINVADRFAMDWQLHGMAEKPRIVILVSKFGHCLNDLLHRHASGSLPVDIAAVVSNHDTMRPLSEWHGIPYHNWPVDKANKQKQESKLRTLIDEQKIDLVVLARYMQVLSPELCAALSGRAINIHHSFLPSFKGAKPYHQAHARGVKIIGATAHYVTSDLDEGPIIDQSIERVDHTHTADDLVAIGQDIENLVLSRAVRYHIERRVLLNGHKTVVFK